MIRFLWIQLVDANACLANHLPVYGTPITTALPHDYGTEHRHSFSLRSHMYHHTTSIFTARNVVFYCLLVKANNAKKSCQLFLCFAVALKGLVCKLAVEQQIQYSKRLDLPTDAAVQVVSIILGGGVYPW